MDAIIKCKQEVSQDKCKAMKNNKETNRKHKEFVTKFEPPLYVPAFTTVKDFHYILKGNYKRSTQDRSIELPLIQPLHKRDLNTKKV